ncbi:MAG: tail fiber protein [Actinomycetota bacterium]
MSEAFLSEIRIMSFGFPPKGWALCNGQLLPINQNQALFSLLGTTYGGDGRQTFALPNLQGRVPIHTGNGGPILGQQLGEQAHTLSISEMPTHTHALQASSSAGNDPTPASHVLASPLNSTYRPFDSASGPMAAGTVANTGASQPHENMQPYLTLSFCIALQGIFPTQN